MDNRTQMLDFIKLKRKRKRKEKPNTLKVTGYVLFGIASVALLLRVWFLIANDRYGGLLPNLSGQLLFIARRDNNNDIFIVDGSGDIRNLTNSVAQENDAAWLPDGVHIVFAASDEAQTEQLYIMNADGSEVRPLNSREAAHSQAYLLRSSADGAQVLWGAVRLDMFSTGWYMVDVVTGDTDIMNPATNYRWLSEGNPLIFGDNDLSNVPDSIDNEPVQNMSLSPDGQHLALTTTGRPSNPDHLYRMDTNNGDLTLVESAPYIGAAVWSPDNVRIAYVGTSLSEPPHIIGNSVLVVDTEAITSQVVIGDIETISHIEWSPDGQQIAFIAHDENLDVYNLYVIDADSSNLRQLVADVLNTYSFKWRPR